MWLYCILSMFWSFSVAAEKPSFESLLTERSQKSVLEDLEVVTNAQWKDEDFTFINAAVVRAPFRLARESIMNFALYPRMSSAIKKIEYDAKTGLLELSGEAGGLHMHSWMQVDLTHNDIMSYRIVRGDMVGFEVNAYLWDYKGKTIAFARGMLPRAKTRFPKLVTFALPTLAEMVLSIATKNFRKFIEEDYNSKRRSVAR